MNKEHGYTLMALLLIGIVVLTASYLSDDNKISNPFRSGRDATFYATMGFKINDPSLYPHDDSVNLWVEDYPHLYYTLLPNPLESYENFALGYVVLTYLLGLIYTVGVYWLAVEVTGNRSVGILTAIASITIERAVIGSDWGWGTGLITPGRVVVASIPFLFASFTKWHQSTRCLMALSAILGILIFLQPQLPIHVFLLLNGTILLSGKFSRQSLRKVLLDGLAFAPFAVCFVISYVDVDLMQSARQVDVMVPEAVQQVRWHSQFIPDLKSIGFSIAELFFPAVIGGFGFLCRRKTGLTERDKLAFILLLALPLILAFLIVPIQAFPALRINFLPLRSLGYLFPFFYIYGACLIVAWLAETKWSKRTLAVFALALLLFFNFKQTLSLTKQTALFRQVSSWYQRFYTEEYLEARAITRTGAARADEIAEDWTSFYELADWARTHTAKEDVFVIPPNRFDLFRLYSQRGILTSFDDGLIVSRSAKLGVEWWTKYTEATAAYEEGATNLFIELAVKYGADYVIVERNKQSLDLPIAYGNKKYVVYALQ